MSEQEGTGFVDFLRRWWYKIRDWMKPKPGEVIPLQVLKFILKCVGLLLLVAFSPVILVILLFVFFAAF